MDTKSKTAIKRALKHLVLAHGILDTASSVATDTFDDMSEGRQNNESGQRLEQTADDLFMAAISVDNLMTELTDLLKNQ